MTIRSILDIFALLQKFLAMISPQLRAAIEKGLVELEAAAAKTDNKLDDFLVAILRIVTGFHKE
jgi:hypothetical protein